MPATLTARDAGSPARIVLLQADPVWRITAISGGNRRTRLEAQALLIFQVQDTLTDPPLLRYLIPG